MSVVIRCGDDERVFKCIESIDEDVEIIVSTCDNSAFQRKLDARSLDYVVSPRGNLSVVSNIGFDAAKYDRVLITDSDTTFEKGCIFKMFQALDEYKVVRAKLRFKERSDLSLSRVVAEARDYVNSLPLVYTPGIAVRKDLLPDIGGFLFNPPVPYAVDADLDYRIKNSKIPVKFLDDAVIYHDAEDLKHDMKAAYRIGRGCAVSSIHLPNLIKTSDKNHWATVKKLKGVKFRNYRDVLDRKGTVVLAYQLLWDTLFYAGAVHQSLRRRSPVGDGQ
jgi:glycosyltransferase involved in cell wall biosynthesis